MTTRMIHPEHGAMHAYDAGEIERLQKLGWAVEIPVVATVTQSVVVTYNAPPTIAEKLEEAKRKPGRPPKAK
jgi:hypothetical protein